MSGSELARRRQAKAAMIETVSYSKDDKGARCQFRAPFVNRLKFYRASQPKIFRERVCPDQDAGLVVLDRDALAALVSPCLDDQPAASGLHPLAKSMGLCPMPIIGLVCSLWHSLVSLKT